MTIDKSPRPLLKLETGDLVQSLNIIAGAQWRIRTEYNKYTREYTYLPFKIQKQEVCIQEHLVTNLEIGFDPNNDKPTFDLYFLNPQGGINYTDFYTRNKYDMKRLVEANTKLEEMLASWQDTHSKNHKKDVHKVVEQFRRTQSVQCAVRIFDLLPKLRFTDTRRYQRGHVFDRFYMKHSEAEETKLKQLKDINDSKAKLKSLQSELVREGEKLIRLEAELKQLKQA